MPRPTPSRGAKDLSRRTFLKGSAVAGGVVLGGGLWSTAIRPSSVRAADTPIRHILVDMQENRSFDHYYGSAPLVKAAGFGIPDGYTQPDGAGGTVAPYHFTDLQTPDIPHYWSAVHDQWDMGKMDGFYTSSGI